MNDFKKIVAAVKKAKKVLISSHINLDGDALGSELALYHLMRHMGKKAHVINHDNLPLNFRFLPGADDTLLPSALALPYDFTFMLDCGQSNRAGEFFNPGKKGYGTSINIDHHITGTPWADLNYIDQSASSTAELIFRLITAVIPKPTLDMACCIYTGLMTDTGSFRYSNTTANVLSLASELVEMGVDPAQIASHVYENVPFRTIRLLGQVISSVGITDDGLVSWISIPASILKKTGTSLEDTEDFINYPRSIPTVAVAICFKEVSEREIKVSLRSRGRVDVSRMALRHGGGGHINAAGCNVKGTLKKVMENIIEEIHQELTKY